MEKGRFRALNARPSKKVMQAVGRKRLKARRLLTKLAEKEKADPTFVPSPPPICPCCHFGRVSAGGLSFQLGTTSERELQTQVG